MKDYSKPYRGVAWFGLWAEESADIYGGRAALDILAKGIERTQDDDIRADQDILDALAYLTEQAGGRLPPAAAYRAAIDIHHPVTRRRAMADAYRRLCRATNNRLDG